MNNDFKKWYIINTYSGYEKKVKINIESRIKNMNMEKKIFKIIIPEKKKKETSKRFYKIFPCYILIEMIMDDDSWLLVKNTPGVIKFVGTNKINNKPEPLLYEEVKRIINFVNNKKENNFTEFYNIKIGKMVKIIKGVFCKKTGEIIGFDIDKKKIKINIDIFGRKTSTELNFDQVELF